MNESDRLAVCVFAYNRPQKLRDMLRSLKKCVGVENCKIFFFLDGPKKGSDSADIDECLKNFNTIMSEYDVEVSKSLINMGLKKSIIQGVSSVTNRHKYFVVVEDDLVLHRMFLVFIDEALRKYEGEDRIVQISGYSSGVPPKYINNDCFFTQRPHSWGWGSWSTVWKSINWDVSFYDEAFRDKLFRKKFREAGSDLMPMMKASVRNKISSWAVIFACHVCVNDKWVCYPKFSLVRNKGFGDESTNCKIEQSGKVFWNDLLAEIRLPKELMIDKKICQIFYSQYSLYSRIKRRILAKIFSR